MAGTDHLKDLAESMRRQFQLDSLPLPRSDLREASGAVRLLEVLHRATGGQIPEHAVVEVDEEAALTTLHFLLPGVVGHISVASRGGATSVTLTRSDRFAAMYWSHPRLPRVNTDVGDWFGDAHDGLELRMSNGETLAIRYDDRYVSRAAFDRFAAVLRTLIFAP